MCRLQLESSFPPFFITNADGLIHLGKKNLSVADLPGSSRFQYGLHGAVDEVIWQHHFDLYFWKKVHFVFAAAVSFGMALLPPVAPHLGNRHPLDADLVQSFFDGFEARRLDDRFNTHHRVFSPGIIHKSFDLPFQSRPPLCRDSKSYPTSPCRDSSFQAPPLVVQTIAARFSIINDGFVKNRDRRTDDFIR